MTITTKMTTSRDQKPNRM